MSNSQALQRPPAGYVNLRAWCQNSASTKVFVSEINSTESTVLIPMGVTEVLTSSGFNKQLVLAYTVRVVSLGALYSQDIPLHEGIEYLEICGNLRKDLVLPRSMRIFRVKGITDGKIVPNEGLKFLEIGSVYKHGMTVPRSVTSLIIGDGCSALVLPPHLEYLVVGKRYGSIVLPHALRKLVLKDRPSVDDLVCLPALEELTLLNWQEGLRVPSTLKKLMVHGYSMSEAERDMLPKGCALIDDDIRAEWRLVHN